MAFDFDTLIYDRTEADVARVRSLLRKWQRGTATAAEKAEFLADMKGAWNASDLNRVESCCEYMVELLHEAGNNAKVGDIKTDWIEGDVPLDSDVERIRSNEDALQDCFFPMPDWIEILHDLPMNWEQANALEWNFAALKTWLERLWAEIDFRRSGELFAGEL